MTTDPMSQRFAGIFFALFLTLLYYWLRDRSDPITPFAAIVSLALCAVWLSP